MMKLVLFAILSVLSVTTSCRNRQAGNNASLADLKSPCSVHLEQGKKCIAKLPELRPTQFAVGMREVETKIKQVQSGKDLEAIPVVVAPGPGPILYVIDHHHLGLAMIKSGLSEAKVEIVKDWSDKSLNDFWEKMNEHQFLYLFDERGNGPHPINDLPINLMQLKDDPYRSLAEEVRLKGGFDKSDKLFAEFQWAQFFRTRINVGYSESAWQTALDAAVRLAKSPEASDLPGYNGDN